MKNLGVDYSIIGGQAISANLATEYENVKNFNLRDYKNIIRKVTRDTSDIDVIVNNEISKDFYSNFKKYFGSSWVKKEGKYNQIDFEDSTGSSPYVSFHFIKKQDYKSKTEFWQNKYYKDFVKSSKKLKIKSNKNNFIEASFANPLDLTLMKLKSQSERATNSKKFTDLKDVSKMMIILKKEGKNINDVINRMEEINYSAVYENKVKNGLANFKKYCKNKYNNLFQDLFPET